MSSQSQVSMLLFVESLRRHVQLQPESTALNMPDGKRSYSELVANAERIAGRLQAAGCGVADRVALIAGSSCSAMEVAVAAAMMRALPVPISSSLQPDSMRTLLLDCAPSAMFVASEFVGLLRAALEGSGLADAIIVVLDDAKVEGLPNLGSWLAENPAPYQPQEADPADLLMLIYSSGTTSVPKGIPFTNGARSKFWAAHGKEGGGGMLPGSRFVLTTAFYTTATFASLLSTLYNGGEAGALGRFDPEDFIQKVEAGQITATFLVPVQMRRILEVPGYSKERMRGLRYTLMSGALTDVATKRRLIENWPGIVIDTYGCSETQPLAALDIKAEPDRLESVGRITKNTDVVILGDDDGILPTGGTGEIVGHTPYMIDGYYNRPDLTKAIEWDAPDGRRFLRTGDIGHIDADGYLHVTDRKKDMIVSGGANIYSADIEAVIATHPDVADVAVIGIPSERWGETPYAIIVPKKDGAPNQAELLAWINSRLGKMARLSGLEYRSELVRNGMGKVLKREMREPFWKDRKLRVA